MLILSPRHFIFLKLNLKQFCNIFHDCCSQLCTTTEKWSWPPCRVFCRQSRAFFAAAVSLCRLTIKSPSRRSTRAPDHLCLEYPGRLMAWLLWNLERKVQRHRAAPLCLGSFKANNCCWVAGRMLIKSMIISFKWNLLSHLPKVASCHQQWRVTEAKIGSMTCWNSCCAARRWEGQSLSSHLPKAGFATREPLPFEQQESCDDQTSIRGPWLWPAHLHTCNGSNLHSSKIQTKFCRNTGKYFVFCILDQEQDDFVFFVLHL